PGTGTTLTATLLTTTSHGSLTFNPDGSFTYTPAANFTGSDSFTYQAVDVASHSSPATVLIEVVPAGSLVFDDFTRATDPAPLSPWVAAQGSWTITGGMLQAASSGSYSDAYLPGSWSNVTVQGSIRFPATAWAGGLSARVNPATG